MSGNPVIAAWVAGGLIWATALVGLGALSEPGSIDDLKTLVQQSPWQGADGVADAYERALDGDSWGDRDAVHEGGYRRAAMPGS